MQSTPNIGPALGGGLLNNLHPPIPAGVTLLLGITRAAEVIAAGETAAQEAMPEIRKLMDEPT